MAEGDRPADRRHGRGSRISCGWRGGGSRSPPSRSKTTPLCRRRRSSRRSPRAGSRSSVWHRHGDEEIRSCRKRCARCRSWAAPIRSRSRSRSARSSGPGWRSGSLDRRRPIPASTARPAPRAPIQYAVSHVERYLDCPFKYFSSYVLGLEEERDEEAGLSPRERGQFLHDVFQRFFVAWEAAGHRSITAGHPSGRARSLRERRRDPPRAAADADRALERTYLLGSAAASGLAERAFAFEIEQGAGVVERLLEHPSKESSARGRGG